MCVINVFILSMIHQRGLTKKTELTIREFECTTTLFHLHPGQSDKYFGPDIKEQWIWVEIRGSF
jgi:hypothetical protein